MILFLENITN